MFGILLVVLSSLASTNITHRGERVSRPVPAIEHAVIISIDGLRPDVLLRADAPNLRQLMKHGSFTMWARTVAESITLPSHTSMLTGVTPQRHGVTWNGDLPAGKKLFPQVPTIFEVAKAGGLSTAIATGKTKFEALARPGSVDWESIQAVKDDAVGAAAVELLREHQPDLLVVHFPGADVAGHSIGWGTPEQVTAVEKIDVQVGNIMRTLDELSLRPSTVVLVSADHGGAGRSHGPNDVRARHIPWIISGPGIRENYDLTRNPLLSVQTEDTFATISYLLGLPLEAGLDGKPVADILETRELMHDIH